MRTSRGAPSWVSAAGDGNVDGEGAVIGTYLKIRPVRQSRQDQEMTGPWRRCARSRAISESHAATLPAPGLKRHAALQARSRVSARTSSVAAASASSAYTRAYRERRGRPRRRSRGRRGPPGPGGGGLGRARGGTSPGGPPGLGFGPGGGPPKTPTPLGRDKPER